MNGSLTSKSSLNGTGTARSASEVHALMGSDEIRIMQKIDMDNAVCQICDEFEIQPSMGKHIPKLANYQIVMVCDDSGSMKAPIDRSQRTTRWDELCSIVKKVLRIAMIFDSDGVDIYFLNRGSIRNVKDAAMIDQLFATPPKGFTPLVPVLQKIFQSDLAHGKDGKKLLVFVATDGEPTDQSNKPNVPELQNLMNNARPIDTTYVSFLLCTDDSASVNYLRDWDQSMKHVDVTDDFHTERELIRRHRHQPNFSFSPGDYIVKALVGAFVSEIDLLNEPNKPANGTTKKT